MNTDLLSTVREMREQAEALAKRLGEIEQQLQSSAVISITPLIPPYASYPGGVAGGIMTFPSGTFKYEIKHLGN